MKAKVKKSELVQLIKEELETFRVDYTKLVESQNVGKLQAAAIKAAQAFVGELFGSTSHPNAKEVFNDLSSFLVKYAKDVGSEEDVLASPMKSDSFAVGGSTTVRESEEEKNA